MLATTVSPHVPRRHSNRLLCGNLFIVSRDAHPVVRLLGNDMGGSFPRAPTLSFACSATTWVSVSGHESERTRSVHRKWDKIDSYVVDEGLGAILANHWWEIQIFCEPVWEDLIFWRLEKFGCKGTSSENKGNATLVKAYLPQEDAQLLDLVALSLWLQQDAQMVSSPMPAVQWHLIDEEDWASSWKQYWHPLEIGDRFLIYPAWLPVPGESDRLLLRLDPGTAFGMGGHATTQLCLEALEMRLGEDGAGNSIVADIGCGSGILSIGAILLGASKVYAVDIDPMAVRATRSNGHLNQMGHELLDVKRGRISRLLEMTSGPVDGIACNILAEVIIDIIPQLEALVKPTTWGIISGVLLDQVKPVADTLEQHGWIVATLWRRQEWCCFNIRRS